MNLRDLYWFAGLFEGEGCIGQTSLGNPTLAIAMTDEDTVRRAHRITGLGNVKARPKLTKGGKRMWTLLVGRSEEAASLLMTMYPLLGERRGERAREVLATWRAARLPKRLRTHCPSGHPYSGENLKIDRSRQHARRLCRECGRRRSREYMARKRREASGVFTLSGASS